MKLLSGIVDSGFFAQSALSAEVATKDSLGRNISETYLTGVDLTPYQTTAGMTAYANSAEVTGTAQYGLTTAGWSEITGGGGVTGDFTLVEGNGIQLTDDPIAQTTTISVSGDYATNTQLQNVSADITAMIPTALTGDYLDKASADTLYYPLESNPNGYLTAETDWTNTITAASANAYNEATAAIPTGLATEDWVTAQGYLTGVDLTPYQTTAGMTAYMSTGDSANFYTTANESGFVTSGELPDPITIGVQEGDTLDTDYDGLKIVKATANGNEHINLHKKSTDQWLIHGGLVPTSPGSNKYLVTDDSGAMHWDNKSALAYDSAFEQSGGYITAYNGSAFKAGDEFPQSATEAIETVTANSADWNGTTETVSSNSGVWGGSALPISAGPGIALNLVDGVLVISTAGE